MCVCMGDRLVCGTARDRGRFVVWLRIHICGLCVALNFCCVTRYVNSA